MNKSEFDLDYSSASFYLILWIIQSNFEAPLKHNMEVHVIQMLASKQLPNTPALFNNKQEDTTDNYGCCSLKRMTTYTSCT